MPAITSTIAAGVSLAGMGMSTAQAINAKKQAKEAENVAKAAANEIMGLKEQNPFASVQVPTLGTEIAQQGLDRAAQNALQVSQGAGAEGVIGGVGQITQGMGANELDLAAQANELKYQRDVNQANAQSGINERQVNRQADLLDARLEGSQLARANAINNKNKAIQNIFGAGLSALGYANEAAPLYGKQSLAKGAKNTLDLKAPTAMTPEQQQNQLWGGNPYYSLGMPQ